MAYEDGCSETVRMMATLLAGWWAGGGGVLCVSKSEVVCPLRVAVRLELLIGSPV